MSKSLWLKFLILLLSVSLVSLSAALFLREMIIDDFKEYFEGKAEDKIYRIMAAIEGSYEKYSGWREEELKENAIWALLLGYQIRIYDNENKELINTAKAVDTLSPLMKRRITALSGFPPDDTQTGQEAFMNYPLFLGGKGIGSLDIKSVLTEVGERKETIFVVRSNRFLFLSLLFLGGLSIIVSLIVSKKLTDPLKKLTAAAKEISKGNIKTRVSVPGNDEISDLSKAFNAMASNLELQETLRKKMTSNIAHELRTPITVMQGELEGMIDGLIKTDRERFLSLHEETVRLRTIVEGIEELARAQSSILELRKQSIGLSSFLGNITERFQKLFHDKGVSLKLECEDKATLFGDPDKVSQIVINLVINALNATEKGGNVLIKAGNKAAGGYIEIKDTGCGIRKEDMPFIFERFYKSSQKGLGLGLTIAKELADAHGGRIDVDSEYGKGATFTLFIPDFTTSS